MNKLFFLLSLIVLTTLFTGCSKKEGPAEQMGKKIDESVESSKKATGEAAEKTTKKIEEIGDISKGPAERAGERIDETVERLKDTR